MRTSEPGESMNIRQVVKIGRILISMDEMSASIV